MEIRPFQKHDVPAISQIYVKTWQDTYLGLIPFGYLYDMSVSKLEREFVGEMSRNGVICCVAEVAGRVVGFVSGGQERQGNGIYNGEIYALYVSKNHQRKGIGTELVSALGSQLNQIGIYSMLVRVLNHNPYRRFYEKLNGIYLRKQQMPFAGEMLDVVLYGWIDTGLVRN